MKQSIYILLLSIFIISCTSNTILKKPKNLIPEKEMVDLLVDMEIAMIAKNIKNKDNNQRVDYMPFVYEKYGIDSAHFVRSNYYYASDIDNYSKLLEKVQNRLNSMEEKYEDLLFIQDSLNGTKKLEKREKSLFESISNEESILK